MPHINLTQNLTFWRSIANESPWVEKQPQHENGQDEHHQHDDRKRAIATVAEKSESCYFDFSHP